jgi:hypothetical protein
MIPRWLTAVHLQCAEAAAETFIGGQFSFAFLDTQ